MRASPISFKKGTSSTSSPPSNDNTNGKSSPFRTPKCCCVTSRNNLPGSQSTWAPTRSNLSGPSPSLATTRVISRRLTATGARASRLYLFILPQCLELIKKYNNAPSLRDSGSSACEIIQFFRGYNYFMMYSLTEERGVSPENKPLVHEYIG